ncbi:MAG TPA: hypothetical protein VEY30_07700, partial [Myxococcaceae bacterium]|nr:hypothetical protein [Myxococcaceae bacterium]
MAQAFSVSGKLLLSEGLVPGALWIDAGRIVEVARGEKPTHFPVPTVKAEVVSPGLIDAQVNGGFGVTVGVEGHAVSTLAVHLPSTGVTAFCPTLVSLEAGAYRQLFNAPPAALPPRGAYPIGWHLEGPFLTPERRGAHGQEAVARADDALFDMLLSV